MNRSSKPSRLRPRPARAASGPFACLLLAFARLGFALLAAACSGNPVSGTPADLVASDPARGRELDERGEIVTPPFDASGDLDGFLLTWFDAEGVHSAQKLSEIPEARREHVKLTPLNKLANDERDPNDVYVVDARSRGKDDRYVVRVMSRDAFDALIDLARPPLPEADPNAAAATSDDVIIYKASWCGACKAAAAFLRDKHVPFVEKDVEKDASAQGEMLRKAQAKGLSPTGVPVIDFRGEVLLGFDRVRLAQLIARDPQSI